MYYISSHIDGRYGVTDTSDGVEEFYTKQKLRAITQKGIDIIGVCANSTISIYDIGYKVYYVLQDIKDNSVKLKKCICFMSTNYANFTKTLQDISCSMSDLAKLKMSAEIQGLNEYLSSQINVGDAVVYGTKDGIPFLVKESLVPSDYSGKVDFFNMKKYYCKSKPYMFRYFNSDLEIMQFCSQNRLTIANELFTNNSDDYWALCNYDNVYVDRVLRQGDRFINLCYTVTINMVGYIDSLYIKKTGKELLTTEYGYGCYNPKGNCFHFAPYGSNYLISFELGTSQPESEILLNYNYNWQADIKKYGVCIVRASMHAKKQYKSDIQFYAK